MNGMLEGWKVGRLEGWNSTHPYLPQPLKFLYWIKLSPTVINDK